MYTKASAMRRIHLILTIVAAGCGRPADEKEASEVVPYDFEMKTFSQASREGCAPDSLGCALYRITYPEFAGLSEQVSEMIMRRMYDAVDTGNINEVDNSFRSLGAGFVNSFNQFSDTTGPSWYYLGSISPGVNTDSLIAMRANAEFFTGGPHGGATTYFLNIDPQTGKDIPLSDYFDDASMARLNALAEQKFRSTHELSPTASLADAGFEFQDDQFALNDNFGFMTDGLHFVFNAYEIAPFALGMQEIVLSYREIKPLMHARNTGD